MHQRRIGSVLFVSLSLVSLSVVLWRVDAFGAVQASEAAGSSVAQSSAANIPAEQAAQHVGETNTVCGLVASAKYLESSRGKPTLLNFGHPYPDHVFSVMIPDTARSKFKDPPEAAFTGKTVCVTGAIIEFRGKPEIVVQDPSQMVVSESAGQTATNAVQKAPATKP